MDKTALEIFRRRESDEIVLTDRDLVSRYIRYSENLDEVSYSPEKACAEPASSSPASAASNHDGDTSHISAVSNSTTQTTPLRNDLIAMTIRTLTLSPLEKFERILRNANLRNDVKDEYRAQSHNILWIGGHLFSQHRWLPQPGNRMQITSLIEATGDWLAAALDDAESQIQNISYVQTLGPFTASPGPDEMWPVYKQMVELLVKHTKPPSTDVVDLLEALALVYDAYVYQPALVGPRMLDTDDKVELQLHGLYDALMSLLMKHQEWCRSTKALKKNHMRPVLESIVSTPRAIESIIDDDAARKGVDAVLNDPANPGYLPVSAEALKVLREKRSTHLLQMRTKRQFARVHTV